METDPYRYLMGFIRKKLVFNGSRKICPKKKAENNN